MAFVPSSTDLGLPQDQYYPSSNPSTTITLVKTITASVTTTTASPTATTCLGIDRLYVVDADTTADFQIGCSQFLSGAVELTSYSSSILSQCLGDCSDAQGCGGFNLDGDGSCHLLD